MVNFHHHNQVRQTFPQPTGGYPPSPEAMAYAQQIQPMQHAQPMHQAAAPTEPPMQFSAEETKKAKEHFSDKGDVNKDKIRKLLDNITDKNSGKFKKGKEKDINILLAVLQELGVPRKSLEGLKKIFTTDDESFNELRRIISQDIKNTASIAHKTDDANAIQSEKDAFRTLFDDQPLQVDYRMDNAGMQDKMKSIQDSEKFKNASKENRARMMEKDVLEPINRSALRSGATIGEYSQELSAMVTQDLSSPEAVKKGMTQAKNTIAQLAAAEHPQNPQAQKVLREQMMTSLMASVTSVVTNQGFEKGEERANILKGIGAVIREAGPEKDSMHNSFISAVAMTKNAHELFDDRTGGNVHDDVKNGEMKKTL